MERPPDSELHKQTLWLFGVLVGLAIKEALTGVYKDISGQEHFWGGSREVIRLFIFLLLILRFYLGAVQYFYGVYSAPNANTEYPNKTFRLDFFFGLGHFIIMCILGLATTSGGKAWWLFPAVLAFVLSYDVFWYWASRKLSTKLAIRLWTVINVVTVAFATLIFLVTAFTQMFFVNGRQMTLTEKQIGFAEALAYVPVLFFSTIDLGSLLHKRSAIEEWLAECVHRPKILGGD